MQPKTSQNRNSIPPEAAQKIEQRFSPENANGLETTQTEGEPQIGVTFMPPESEKSSSLSLTPAEQLARLLQKGVDAWTQAGRFYVEMLNSDPDFAAKVRREFPEITTSILSGLEKIGRGLIHPKLLLNDSRPGIKSLLGQPYSIQARFVEELIPVVIGEETIHIHARDLTLRQSRQVFSRDGIRSVSEQRQWLFEKTSAQKPPYKIIGDRVLIPSRTFFSARDLKKILDELSKA